MNFRVIWIRVCIGLAITTTAIAVRLHDGAAEAWSAVALMLIMLAFFELIVYAESKR